MMRTISRYITLFMILLAGTFCVGRAYSGQPAPGREAPLFSLRDLQGGEYDISLMKDKPMAILYFFDVESIPSQEGLLTIDDLARRYKDKALAVWAITLSSTEKTSDFVKRSGLSFPVLLDEGRVSDLYQASIILPTVCILGPGLKVLDYFQGGGKTTEVMLVRLAERELQQKRTQMAKAISEEVVKKNPRNIKAEMVKGYAALKEGKVEEAETVFTGITRKGEEGDVMGKEGLTAVYARKGDQGKALALVREIEEKAPERAFSHVIKGDILYAQGKREEAEAAFRESIRKREAEIYQEPVRYNQLGRLYAKLGKYEKARELYDQAVAIDPYYIEATTNKGVTYEREGNWEAALASYRQAMAVDKEDSFAAVLAAKAQEMLELQRDVERKKRMDLLVKELAERYRSRKEAEPEDADKWTSRQMVLSFVDFQESGGLAERDGFSRVLTAELTGYLNSSGRLRVVERILMERLLEELNIGSSELADTETALRLGKILAAKLIGTGSLLHMPNATLLSFRLIDTETSAIPKVITRELGPQASLKNELYRLNREILKTVIAQYPLQGYIVKATGDQAIINLGSNQGVVQGTRFEVLEEEGPMEFKGKVLHLLPKPIGEVEVVKVEHDLCYARILDQKRAFRMEDKVRERMIEEGIMGGTDAL